MKAEIYGAGLAVQGIKLSPDADAREAFKIAAEKLRRAGVNPARLHFRIYRKSVDARNRKNVMLVYTVAAFGEIAPVADEKRLTNAGIVRIANDMPKPVYGNVKMTCPPIVVGMGPAGMFCALMLAENGYKPVIIDRGDEVAERCRKNNRFVESGILDTESNIQFGAGGAGTFSDGKLMTRISDPNINYIMRRFCDFGAPEEILVSSRPHIGTDRLVEVVDRMLKRISELGGRVIYRCRLDGISENSDGSVTAHTTQGDIAASALVLAPGHSSRDTYSMLMERGYAVEAKPFSVGVRVEHLQKNIDKALYGDFAGHPALGHAEYHLSDTRSERGVYTFCMCPGGQVVAAASEEGGVVVNGMSRFLRDGTNSNSAVAVSVRPEDYGATPEGAIEFQRKLERAAFRAGGGDYCAPVQTMGDFLAGELKSIPSEVMPTYRDGRVRCAELDSILPPFVVKSLRYGFESFDKKLHGFASPSALLTAVETRTSAPVRILRTDDFTAPGHPAVYPCGEGAGYTGGITSAAADGIKVSLAVMRKFAVPER